MYNVPSSGPPSACTNIQLVHRTDASFTISWSRPEIIGRDDFFYRVLYSDPDRIGEFITENDNITNNSTVVHYTVSGLIPLTSYIVRVTTHNAVSDQDPNSHLRMCGISNMTLEGGKNNNSYPLMVHFLRISKQHCM